MADWLVHYATGRVAASPARGVALRECILLGVVLPDVSSKIADFGLYFGGIHGRPGFYPGWAVVASHAPLLWAGAAYAIAHLWAEALRPAAFAGLALGGWLHIATDLSKDGMGSGAVPLLFPFSTRFFEFGAGGYFFEDTLKFAPWALGAVLVVEVVDAWRRKRSKIV